MRAFLELKKRRKNGFANRPEKKRRASILSAAGDRGYGMPDKTSCEFRRKNDRRSPGLELACTEPLHSPLCGAPTDGLQGFQVICIPGHRIPEVSLHLAILRSDDCAAHAMTGLGEALQKTVTVAVGARPAAASRLSE